MHWIAPSEKDAASTSLEKRLWDAADQFRANSGLKAQEYSGPILGLIFLRFAEVRFAIQRTKLEGAATSSRRGSRIDEPAAYHAEGILYLAPEARFDYLLTLPEVADIGAKVNAAMREIEKHNPQLAGVLPKTFNLFTSTLLKELLKKVSEIPATLDYDAFGRIYEYFLGAFAMTEGQGGGEFYTPSSIVKLLAEIIEPFHGRILDPACGSGGMFVQSARFVAEHQKNPAAELAICGVEKTDETGRLCRLNLAVHGLEGDIKHGGNINSYYDDPHNATGQFDFVLANPPFNVNAVDKERLKDMVGAGRRFPFGLPRTDNANYLWIQLFYSALNATGRAGFVMANSASDARSSEQELRQKLIEARAVDVMVAVGPNMFYTVTLPCTLWFFDKGKTRTPRADTVLFIDARHIYRQVDRAHRDWTPAQIGFIANLVRLYRGETLDTTVGGDATVAKLKEIFGQSGKGKPAYADVPGLCKAATLAEIEAQGWSLNPGRYVGVAPGEDVSDEDFKAQLVALNEELKVLNAQARELERTIAANVESILDLVFISSATALDWAKAQKSLTDGGVNDRLLDCSDAHRHADSSDKDRLAKCFTWIKADPTFEGLRQAVYEYASRVHVADVPPIEPFLQIKKVTLTFPDNALLSRGERSDVFCFRGTRDITFSPFLTCIIGGRGTGKSTLLNLIHEKLDAGSTEFFKQNKLSPAGSSVASGVSIEGVSEKSVVEFLQQNEIEQFASDHQRLTSAIFTRLRKLDAESLLQENEDAVDAAIASTQKQLDRLKNHHELSEKLANSKKELTTQKGIVESFQNTDYKRINDELTVFNKELQGLKTSRTRLGKLVQDLKILLREYPDQDPNRVANLNAYEQQIRSVVEILERGVNDAVSHPSLAAAGTLEQEIADKVRSLRGELDKFLKARGLSEENLSDVGKATERIAELEEEITRLNTKVSALYVELGQFTAQRDKADLYATAVEALLAPVNIELKGQGAEVKPIELLYRFDLKAFRVSMIEYVASAIGQLEGRAPRPDYVDSNLKGIDFTSLGDRKSFLAKIPDGDGVYAKTLREYFAQDVNFETLKLQVELQLLDMRKFGQIYILYDGKPVENSSFGQRCTAVIVVLLLLGNMPIVIDEPEAHLDSSLIAKYLVDLIKARKKHRQIIFATHNANFVINGDADLIHCMSMDEWKVTKVTSTTIEDLANREMLLALEGGEKAFHQREKRYGID